MKETLKKTFLLGLGAAALTKKELEKKSNVLIKKSGITVKDSKEVLGKILFEANKGQNRVNKMILAEVNNAKANLVKVYEPKIKKLKKKIGSLEKRIQKEGRKVAKGTLKKGYKRC